MTALVRKRGPTPFWLDTVKKGSYPFFGIGAFAAILAVWMLYQAPAGAQVPRRLALVGGMLLDGYETPPLHHAAVLIEGNKIVQMGPVSEVKIPAGTPVVDTSGLTMMPGMIEAHAHLSLIGHGDYARYFTWLEQHKAALPMERIMEIAAKQLLMAGVTSAIDLSGYLKESLSVRDRIARGDIPGPRLQVRTADRAWRRRRCARRHGDAAVGHRDSQPGRSRHGHRRSHHRGRRRDQGAGAPQLRRIQGDRRRRAQAAG